MPALATRSLRDCQVSAVTGLEHLRQSVADILTTPVGSRVMRRDYGSLVPELIDQPDNETTQVRLFSAVAGALMRWEPRLRLSRVATARDAAQPGAVVLTIEGVYLNEYSRAEQLALSLQIAGRTA